MIIMLIIVLVVIAIIMRQIIHSQLLPLKALASSTAEVAKGDFKAVLPKIDTQDEIRELRDSFENMQISLSEYIEQLQETTASKAAIESELHVATDIQMSMLPKEFVPIQGHDDVPVYGQLKPAKAVGGDLFDYYVRDETLFFCIGDVSGKGVPASLFMTLATRGFRTLASTGKTPAEIATRLNVELSDNNEMGMFVTMFICMYDLKQGRIEYCNAGHNPPVIGNAEGQYAFLDVKEANAPIGLWPDLEYVGEEMDLPSGGIMLLYTDGLNEAENRQQEQYGEDRIIQLMTSHASLSMRDIIEALKADTDQFRDGAEQNDDLTMLAFRITKS